MHCAPDRSCAVKLLCALPRKHHGHGLSQQPIIEPFLLVSFTFHSHLSLPLSLLCAFKFHSRPIFILTTHFCHSFSLLPNIPLVPYFLPSLFLQMSHCLPLLSIWLPQITVPVFITSYLLLILFLCLFLPPSLVLSLPTTCIYFTPEK